MRYVDYTGPRCDFCADVNPEWSFHTERFELVMVNLDTDEQEQTSMSEEWLICWRCTTLIKMNDRVGLINRCHAIFMHKHPDAEPDGVKQLITLMAANFFAGLKDEPVRVR